MYLSAEFPAKTDSQALYDDVKGYKVNVTDIQSAVYLYGEVSPKYCATLIQICYKYEFIHLDIKNPSR